MIPDNIKLVFVGAGLLTCSVGVLTGLRKFRTLNKDAADRIEEVMDERLR